MYMKLLQYILLIFLIFYFRTTYKQLSYYMLNNIEEDIDLDIRKEVEFWTRIMRDHSEFQYNNLAPSETEAIGIAQYFMNLFEALHFEVMANQISVSELISHNKTAVTQFIDFKRFLLSGLMTCNIKLKMAPTFLNHMINEAFEFLRVLNLADRTIPYNDVIENLRLHNIWLPDASGHASSLAAEIDPVEANFIMEANEFSKRFDRLFKKAYEMYTMYERTRLNNGARRYFNEEVRNTLTEFISFLEKLEDMKDECGILSSGILSPEMLRHMMMEEGYYIFKINEFGDRFG